MGKTTLANPIDFPLPFFAHLCSFPKYLFLILSTSQFFWTVKTNRIFFIENPISVIKYSLSFSWVMLLGRKPYIAYSAVKTKDIISLESDCRLRSSTNLVWQIQVEINKVFRKSIQGRGTSFLITKIPQMFCRMEEENPQLNFFKDCERCWRNISDIINQVSENPTPLSILLFWPQFSISWKLQAQCKVERICKRLKISGSSPAQLYFLLVFLLETFLSVR